MPLDGVGGEFRAEAEHRWVGADVAVVAYPDEILGERACAVVVPRPEAAVTLEEIVAYLREEGIATFKLPERLEIRDELPRNPLGKILKRELRDELRQ